MLGISCNINTDISFSFKILKEHSVRNYHGWGYAYFHDNEWTVVKEPIMALRSEKVGKIITNPLMFTGKMFVSHIRYATAGRKAIENTHPLYI